MKTKNAFALRGFDKGKILQSPVFKDFHFDAEKSDAENVSFLATGLNREELNQKMSVLTLLLRRLADYDKLIEKHCVRLSKLTTKARQRMKKLEALVPHQEEKHEKKMSLSERLRLEVSEQESLQKELAALGKLDEYQEFWGICDTAQGFYFSYDSVRDDIAALKGSVEETYKELTAALKKCNQKIFATNLKRARQAAGLTQRQLAEKIGTTQNSYSSYEIGRADPPLNNLIRLAQELNCTTDSLLGLS